MVYEVKNSPKYVDKLWAVFSASFLKINNLRMIIEVQ